MSRRAPIRSNDIGTGRGRRARAAGWTASVAMAAAVATAGLHLVDVGGVGDVAGAANDDPSKGGGASNGAPTSPNTVPLARRDLARTVDVDGTVTYGDRKVVRSTGAGTITALPETGTVIGPGSALYEVDGRPGPMLAVGSRPLWRTLAAGVEDGPDVRQLEETLAGLGYAQQADVTVDETFTEYTAEAIRLWQEATGRVETGKVEPGDIRYAAGPLRVAELKAEVGAPAQGEVMTVEGTTRVVSVDLDARYSDLANVGAAVTVTLPDDSEVTGTISAVASTATVTPGENGRGSRSSVAVSITLADEVDVLDRSPVQVSLVSDAVKGVLAAPVDAVVALAGGGYALEVVGTGGTTQLVAVQLGRFADGWVQVTGSVREGQKVVTA